MDGFNLSESALLSPQGPGSGDWKVSGVGDFDRDGQGDLLFQHTTGALAAWIMDGTKLRVSGTVSPSSPGDPNWRVVALADFNADVLVSTYKRGTRDLDDGRSYFSV